MEKWKIILLFLPIFAYASGGGGGDAEAQAEADAIATASILDTADFNSQILSFAWGDVEIKDCIYTVQYFIFYQGAKINPLCVADNLDVIGKHKEAAEMRCSIKRYRKPYGSRHQCVRTTMFVAPDNTDEEQLMLQQQVVELQHQYEELKAAPPPEPTVITRTIVDPELKKLLQEDVERRARAREALEGK